ncbi:MAG: bifunctional precorrin-2 dehydrogenase/sirohydrochlorin ferrochelatase [Acidimicrobiales bacterium]
MADPSDLAASRPIVDGYPLVVRLDGRTVLVVGGGAVALRKTEGLLASGAHVRVVSPEFVDGFASLVGAELVQRRYEPADLDGAWLVVAATNDPVVQQQIFDECEARHVFCNAVDDPDRCSFVLPAVERRGAVIVAVSTQGRSPTLAKHLRDRLAAALPDDVDALAERLSAERRALQAQGISTEDVAWPNPLE